MSNENRSDTINELLTEKELLELFGIKKESLDYLRREKRLPFLVGFMWALTSLARFEAITILLCLLVINLLLDVKNHRIDKNYYYKLLIGFGVIFIPYFVWGATWSFYGSSF